jgi:VWFA-related protein
VRVSVLAGVLLPGGAAWAQVSSQSLIARDAVRDPDRLDDLLLMMKKNLADYHRSLPSFFCKEHVVSQVGREQAAVPFRHSVTDSVFRIRHRPEEGSAARFVESHEVERVDGAPSQGKDVPGPTTLTGAFSGGLAFVTLDERACMRYRMLPGEPGGDLRVAFESLAKNERPSMCLVSEGLVGTATIDRASVQMKRVEFTVPRRLVEPATHDPERAAYERTEGTWTIAVDYTRVALGDGQFWMPKTITSTTNAGGVNPVIWSYTAEYSDYHKLEVNSRVLPFTGVAGATATAAGAGSSGEKAGASEAGTGIGPEGAAPGSMPAAMVAAAAKPAPVVNISSSVTNTATPAGQASAGVAADVTTLHVTSRLVFLDVTVVDRQGRTVTGLSKDDFTITEEKQPRRIVSFEASGEGDATAKGTGATIFLLDLLNTTFEDFAFIRYSIRRYLQAQPAEMSAPAELLLLGNDALTTVEPMTRSKAALLAAVERVPVAVPYKARHAGFTGEPFSDDRFILTTHALQEVALQNRGTPGRKNIIWIGRGGTAILPSTGPKFRGFLHETTNLLVEARMSLFVIRPGLGVGLGAEPNPITASKGDEKLAVAAMTEAAAQTNDDPFSQNTSFLQFVGETGGHLFANRNDTDAEIGRAEQWGSAFYTLTYRPTEGLSDGRFKRIRVQVKNPELQVVTKTGYFAPDGTKVSSMSLASNDDLLAAAQARIAFDAVGLTVKSLVRHPADGTVQFQVMVNPLTLGWHDGADGHSAADLSFAATSLNGRHEVLTSTGRPLTVTVANEDPAALGLEHVELPVTVRIPAKAKSVRVVVENMDSGRVGTVDLDRSAIDAAPEKVTPMPRLFKRSSLVPTQP